MTEDSLTDVQAFAAEDEIESSGPGKVKTLLIVLKAAYMIWQTTKAAKVWKKSASPMGKPAWLVLMLSCLVIAAGAIFKFTHKRLMPLFLLQNLGSFCAFSVLHVLVVSAQVKADKKKQIEGHIKMMHVVWCAVFGVALTKFTTCSSDHLYPIAFVLNFGLFGILFVYLKMQMKSKFGL